MSDGLRKFLAGPDDGARLWTAKSDGVELSFCLVVSPSSSSSSLRWAQQMTVDADSPEDAAEKWACLCSLPDGTRITVTEVSTGLEHRLVIEAETTYTAYREPEDHGGGVP